MVGVYGRSFFGAVASCAIALPNVVVAAPEQRHEYHLEAQDLAQALRAVGRTSKREVIFATDDAAGKQTSPLDGIFTAEEAVTRLIRGSGLTAITNRNGAIIIRQRQQLSEAEAGNSAGDGDILVTGSRIRGIEQASQVITQTRENILDAGIANLGDFARSLPQNYSGGQNPGVAGGGNQGGQQNLTSSSTLNLRGLGPDATLTLINGHRVAYDGLAQGVDISAIPLQAIERVEIVPDGSSAQYGSDAVGGVANVILRRDFEGIASSARLGASTDGGNEQQQYSSVAGKTWSSGSLMATVDYTGITAITARHRPYTANLDDSATLVPEQRQVSAFVTGRQALTGNVEFQFDGQFNTRRSEQRLASLATSSAFTNGLVTRPEVRAFTLTPSLRIDLSEGWNAFLSGSHGQSITDIRSRSFFLGNESAATNLRYDNSLDTIEAGFEGPLASLPGGDVRLAAGGGYRRVGLDVQITQASGGTSSTTADTSNARNVLFAYGEATLPLVGDNSSRPLVYRLRLNGAVRYEKYASIGDVVTPKFGLVYAPTPDLTLKGSWGQSFKAPTLNQQFQARDGVLAPGVIFSGFPQSLDVIYISGGSSNLNPERATTWSATVALNPRSIKGLQIEASYFRTKFRNRVVVPFTSLVNVFTDPTNYDSIILNPSSDQIASAIASLPRGLDNLTGLPYDDANIGAIVNGSLQNAARQTIEGLDIGIKYSSSLGPGQSVDLEGSASYLRSEQQLSAQKPTVSMAGTIFDPPHWRARGGATFRHDNTSVSAMANYSSGLADDRYRPARAIRSFTSIDAVVRARSVAERGPLHGMEATVAIINLFNEKPGRILNLNPADPPYDSTNHSAAGRFISLTLTKVW